MKILVWPLSEQGRRAHSVGMDIQVDIIESRDFASPGPTGCNMCGGIVSESLVQTLAAEGINLPPTVIQRGIRRRTESNLDRRRNLPQREKEIQD